MENPTADILTLAANIVSAHVEHNEVSHNEVPRLIREVYAALVEVRRCQRYPDKARMSEAGVAESLTRIGSMKPIH